MATKDVEGLCYDNVLRQAERAFNGMPHPEGGRCRDCVNFRGDCLRALASEDGFEGYGICMDCEEDPQIVPADEWHDWDECWYDEDPSEPVRNARVRCLAHDMQRVRRMFKADYVSSFSLKDEDGKMCTNVTVMREDETIYTYWD